MSLRRAPPARGGKEWFGIDTVKVFQREDIVNAVPMQDLIEPVEQSFVAYSDGKTESPPVTDLQFPQVRGEHHIKAGYIDKYPHFSVKLVSCFYDNPQHGLRTRDGLVVLFSAATGAPEAVLMDGGYLTDVRTAIAGGIAAKYLSRADVTTAGLIGTGTQAYLQLRALMLVREIKRVVVWGRNGARASALVERLAADHGLKAVTADSVGELMEQVDVAIAATPSREPLINGSMLRPGQHVTAMGSDVVGKQELDVSVLQQADVVAADSIEQCYVIGELQHVGANDNPSAIRERVVELGRVISGAEQGRRKSTDVTVADLTGIAVQDLVAADLAYKRCSAAALK